MERESGDCLVSEPAAAQGGRRSLGRNVVCPLLLAAAGLAVGQTGTAASPAKPAATVRFVFDAKPATVGLHVVGGGTLTLTDAPAAGVVQRATSVQSTVVIRRGRASARFTVSATGATYVFSIRIGVRFQQVALVGRITSSAIRGCRVGTAGAITVETEENEPAAPTSSRRPLGRRSFTDDGVVFRLCGLHGEDPVPVARIALAP